MALITDQPEDLETTNTLDGIDDPDEDQESGVRAEIYLSGAHIATLDNAPSGGDRITMMVDLRVQDESVRFDEDGEPVADIRRCVRVGDMYLPGTKRPATKEEIAAMKADADAKREAEARAEAEKVQPPMFADDGEPYDPDAADGPGTDEEAGRPDFSDGAK